MLTSQLTERQRSVLAPARDDGDRSRDREQGASADDVGKLLRDQQAELVETRLDRNHRATESSDPPTSRRSEYFLYYIDRASHVTRRWIEWMVDEQLPSGGWSNRTD